MGGNIRREQKDQRPADAGPGPAVGHQAPDQPTELPRASWWVVLKRTFKEFQADELQDRAAALTYYSVLSLFPALLVMVSVLGVSGRSATEKVLADLTRLAPGSTRELLTQAVQQLQDSAGTGSALAVVGLLAALWTASGYMGAFIRAANAVYDVPEGRPLWKVLPLRLGLTVLLMVLAYASAVTVVFSGALARQTGAAFGIGDSALTVWSYAKWPVLALLAVLTIAVLYWAAPNAKRSGVLWITSGGVLALLLWMAAAGGFAAYVSNFGSYNKTYGALGGVIVFLVWLWITNLAVLLGLEFDAELARARAVAGGLPPDREPYVTPRDTEEWSEEERERLE